MKVAVLGGGYFGCWIACKLSDNSAISGVSLYEKSDSLMSCASGNNQHRFHLGYHYPRSPKTVSQILEAKSSFEKDFGDCTFPISDNLYLVSKQDSLVTATEFSEVFKSHLISEVDLRDYVSELHVDKLEKGFRVREMGLSNSSMKRRILQEISKRDKLKVFTNREITSLEEISFDLVVNCTYTRIDLTSSMRVKYELCALALVSDDTDRSRAFTVVDGKFPSLYPTENPAISTLSHVEKTPLLKTSLLSELTKFRSNLTAADLQKANDDIISAASTFFKMKFTPVGQYLSYKVKLLEDKNDVRTSEVIFDNEKITLLQGKITTLSSVTDQVVQYAEHYSNRQGSRR